MSVSTRFFTARLRFTNEDGESVQTLTRVRSNITGPQAGLIRSGINSIRPTNHPATGGIYTVMDELVAG